MRGRTNIICANSNAGEIDINTEIKKMQVKEGNHIRTGDFVNQIQLPAEQPFSDDGAHRLCNVNNVSGNLYVATDYTSSSGYIVLFTYTDGMINVIDTYTAKPVINILKIGENLFLARRTIASVFTFSVDLDHNCIINMTSFDVSSENNFHKIAGDVIMTYDSYEHYIRLNLIDISDCNHIHNTNEKSITCNIYPANTLYSGSILYIGNWNQKLYFVATNKRKPTSTSQAQAYFHNCSDFIEVTLSDDYSSVASYKIIKSYGTSYSSASTAVETSHNGGMVFENSDVKYIGYIIYESQSNQKKSCTLYLYNPLSEEIVQTIDSFPSDVYLLHDSLIESTTGITIYGFGTNVKIDDNNWIIISTLPNTNKIQYIVCHYNNTDNTIIFREISKISEISNIGERARYKLTFCNNNEFLFSTFDLKSPAYTLTCRFENNSLKLGTYKNTITPYGNYGCPNGIAKEAGSGGEFIDVYMIPN